MSTVPFPLISAASSFSPVKIEPCSSTRWALILDTSNALAYSSPPEPDISETTEITYSFVPTLTL